MAEKNYNLGPVKPGVQQVANLIGNRYSIGVIGGYRSTGSVPNSDHPKGLAIDVMCSIAVGQRIVADCMMNWDAWHISYVIHNRQFWGSPNKPTRYTGPSPHTDHVHISFRPTVTQLAGGVSGGTSAGGPLGIAPDSQDNDDDTTLEDLWEGVTGVYNAIRGIVKLIQFLSDPANWKRIGLALAGGMAILFGLLATLKGPKVLDLRKVVPV